MKRPGGSLISYFSNRVKKEGGINLAQGIPGFPPPPELLALLKDIAPDSSLHQYAPGIGNFQLLELIEQRLSTLCPIDIDNLLVVQGATEGIFLTFFYLTTILKRPFSALSFDPVYESYPLLAEMFNIPFHYTDLEEDLSVDFDRLEKIIDEENVGVVFIASPGNPLGKVWNKDEMTKLVALSQRYGFYIIFDAVYKDIYFGDMFLGENSDKDADNSVDTDADNDGSNDDNNAGDSLMSSSFNPLGFNYERLFYVDSFSKMLSITGWRVGYIVTERGHMEKIRGLHDYTGLCAPSVLQTAVARYLDHYNYGMDYVKSVKTRCGISFKYMRQRMLELGFRISRLDGGYFLWAGLPDKWPDGFEFAMDLYDKVKLGVVPGENFSKTKTNFIRVNIAAEMSVMEDAALRLGTFFDSIR